MQQFILTENGNLLRFHETLKKPYFESPRGEFLRECSNDEFDHICSHGIICESWDERLELEPEFFPNWHFLKSVKVLDDFTNFRSETSCNGGNYSFTHFHDWFVSEYPDGKWKFAVIERYLTSGDFSYDELASKFQLDLGEIYLSNVEGDFRYQTQIGRVWDEENQCWFSSIPEVVEKISIPSTFEQLWNEFYHYLPSKYNEGDVEEHHPALGLTDKKEILRKLKELGCDSTNCKSRKFRRNIRNTNPRR